MSKNNNHDIDEKNLVSQEVSEENSTVEETVESAASAADDAADTVKDAAEEAADTVKDAAKEAADTVKDAAEEAADTAKDAAEEAADNVKDAAKEAADTAKDAVKDAAGKAKEKTSRGRKHESGKHEAKKSGSGKTGKKDDQAADSGNKKTEEKKETKKASPKDAYKKGKIAANKTYVKFKSSAKEMSDDLKNMLSSEIEAMKQKQKRRSFEIISIFAKHNFYAGGFTPMELRTTLEDLGPTYVKIGQIMSSRVDMLPDSYCKELEKLRQNVKPLDSQVARAVIEQETGKKIDEIYSEFRDKPLGSASIGQAHMGVLLDGTKVVTKVQRPLIADMMREDFVLLKKIASAVNTVSAGNDDAEEQIDLLSVITELEKVTEEELDFRIEAKNTIFFKENCIEDETKITCPTIYPELTTERILTMSFVDGYSVADKDQLIKDGYDPVEIGRVIVDNYLHQALDVGTFHADPHQGNIMVSHGLPYWIDFGMIGRLTPANIRMIQDLILAIIETDTEALANAALAMGAGGAKTDRAKLSDDLDAFISKYMSVTSLDDLDTAVLLGELMDLMSDNYITIPGEYTMLVRSIATIEGVIEQLCPELNLFQMITSKLLERAKKNIDVQQSLLSFGKDALAVSKKTARIPSLVADSLNSLVKGRSKINLELTGYQDLVTQFTDMVRYLVLALFSGVIFFGSCILCTTHIRPVISNGMPLAALAGFIFSIALGIYTVKKMTGKKK